MRESDRECLRESVDRHIERGMTHREAVGYMYGVCERIYAEGRMSDGEWQECAAILGERPTPVGAESGLQMELFS